MNMKRLSYKFISLCFLVLIFWSCHSNETIKPQRTDIVDAVFASGHVIMENEYQVTAISEGYLVKANVQEGDTVEAGMPLFQLSNEVQSEQLSNAMATYQDALQNLGPGSAQQAQLRLQIEQAQAQRQMDESNFKRYQNLLKTGAVSRQDFDRAKVQYENSKRQVEILEKSLNDLKEKLRLNLKNAQTQLNIQKENNKDYFLTSSIAGIILHVDKEQGELVRKGEAIAKIGGGKPLAKLFVAEEDIDRIKVGQPVTIELNTRKDTLLDASITKIYPAFDEQQQSFICEAGFLKAPNLYANTQLQANIIINQKKNALVIPVEYLSKGDSVIYENGERVAVKVGIRNNAWVEVLSGLDGSRSIKQVGGL